MRTPCFDIIEISLSATFTANGKREIRVIFLAIILLDITLGNQIFLFLDITLSLMVGTLCGSLDPNYGENCPRVIDLPRHLKLSKAVSGKGPEIQAIRPGSFGFSQMKTLIIAKSHKKPFLPFVVNVILCLSNLFIMFTGNIHASQVFLHRSSVQE